MIELFDHSFVHQIIDAHEKRFGHRPDQVCVPTPKDVVFMGVKMVFRDNPGYFTTDRENCLHHSLDEKIFKP